MNQPILKYTDAANQTRGFDAVVSPRTRGHICFVAPAAYPVLADSQRIKLVGGAEVQQTILAKSLAQMGYTVSMICLDFDQSDRMVIDGVTVYKTHKLDEGIPIWRFVHPRFTSFWKVMKRVNADVYYQRCAGVMTGIVAAFCKLHGKKSIYAGANEPDFVPGKQLIQYARDRLIFEYGLRNVDCIVTQTVTQQKLCSLHYHRESKVIPSCYIRPLDSEYHPNGEILWVSTIRPWKRPEIFLELARRMPEYKFKLIGGPGGPDAQSMKYFEHIEQQAKQIKNLCFKGFVAYSQIEEHFDSASIFVNTSKYEGFPNTFLQAWARGIPTVSFFDTASRIGNETVYDMVTNEEEAVTAIRHLMESDEEREAAGKKCYDYFQSYHTASQAITSYTEVFDALLNK